jgi:CRP/FNR family transcriptional regulator, anaerobic regulatory protein
MKALSPQQLERLRRVYFSLNPAIPDALWQALQQKYQVSAFSKGQVLFHPGEVCDFVGIVGKGLFRMYHLAGEKEVTYEFFEENQLVSDYNSFSGQTPATCTIEALEESDMIWISFQDLEEIYRRHPVMYQTVTRSLDALFVRNFDRYISVLKDSLETRYRAFLETRPGLSQRIPQYMIASFLGITPEALTRLRRQIGM